MKYYTICEEFLPLWTNDTTITTDTIIDEDEVKRLAKAWDNDVDELIEEQLIEVPAPDTLQDLTGQESGIVIYDSGEMIICNWCQAEDHSLPTVLEGICLVWWDNGEDVFGGAKEEYVEDYRPLLDGKELILDQLDDMRHITTETDKDWFRATVYTLTDGTVIIAPKMWN